jgi:tripartite-type tricarboxylate transporter receptor subunit TctC
LPSSRQIRFVVPFPANGGADLLTRVLAEKWGQAHGVSTVIENRPGAASVIGTEAASRAAPDGNTAAETRRRSTSCSAATSAR